MDCNIVEFPGREPPPEGYSAEYVDRLHSTAFRDIEVNVSDLERAGEIAQQLIMECSAGEEGLRELELAQFAVLQLAKMLRQFRGDYQRRWHGELKGPS
jgi:hypothetical protein